MLIHEKPCLIPILKSEKRPKSTMKNLKNLTEKNTGQLIFHQQCIYEISKSYHTSCIWFQRYDRSRNHDIRTDERTELAQSNMASQLPLRRWGHKNRGFIIEILNYFLIFPIKQDMTFHTQRPNFGTNKKNIAVIETREP